MSPHYFFEQPPPFSTPRSRIDTKLSSVVTIIAELFPMARSEIILLKVSAVIAVDLSRRKQLYKSAILEKSANGKHRFRHKNTCLFKR
jgi:hypothetical protein